MLYVIENNDKLYLTQDNRDLVEVTWSQLLKYRLSGIDVFNCDIEAKRCLSLIKLYYSDDGLNRIRFNYYGKEVVINFGKDEKYWKILSCYNISQSVVDKFNNLKITSLGYFSYGDYVGEFSELFQEYEGVELNRFYRLPDEDNMRVMTFKPRMYCTDVRYMITVIGSRRTNLYLEGTDECSVRAVLF